MIRISRTIAAVANKLVHRHISAIYRLAASRPAVVALGALLLLVLSLLSLRTLRLETDVFKLFPAQTPSMSLFVDSLAWTGGSGKLYFLLEGDKPLLLAEGENFAARLGEISIDGKPAFRRISHRLHNEDDAPRFADFLRYAVANPQYFLPPENVEHYLARLEPSSMGEALRRAKGELAAQPGAAGREIIAADPLYLRELILPRIRQASDAFNLDPASPYFLSRDGRILIVIAEPARPVNDMAFARALVTEVNRLRGEAKVEISCAGGHFTAVEQETAMKRTIRMCIVSSLVMVLLLFYLTYRRFLPTLLLPLILLFAVIVALGTAGGLLPSLHIISIAFTALIIGLGTDYSIHIYDRFATERARGIPTEEAVRLAAVETGHGVFTAAVTTSVPFFAFMLSDVRALFELGLLVGLGVLISLYATLFFLPPVLSRMEAGSKGLPTLGLEKLWRLATNHAYAVLGLSLVLVGAAAIAAGHLRFEGDFKKLQPRHSQAFKVQEKVERHLSLAPKQLLVAVEGEELEEVMARGERVENLVAGYRERGFIKASSSLLQIVNGGEAREAVRGGIEKKLSGRNVGLEFRQALISNGFSPPRFGELTAALSGLASPSPDPVHGAIAQLAASPLGAVAERHLVRDAQGSHLLFYLHYHPDRFPVHQFLKELSSLDPAARATSEGLVGGELVAGVKNSFKLATVVGGILVLLLLGLHFRSLPGILYSLVPVGTGLVLMLGLMGGFGITINFMNVMVIIAVIGMGSDYGLHLAHRLKSGMTVDTYLQAGRAVLLSALTTIAGFGSLALADLPALASMGWATNFGVAATSLIALIPMLSAMSLLKKH